MTLTIAAENDIAPVVHPVPLLTTTLRDIAAQCVRATPGSAGCGLNLLTADGRRITSVATDPVAERINALYDLYRENPCGSAWSTKTVIRLDCSSVSAGWAPWQAAVEELGVRCALAAPLRAADRLLGTVLVHSTDQDVYRRADENALAALAGDAALRIDACLAARR